MANMSHNVSDIHVCFQWMNSTLQKPNVTLEEINDEMIRRFLGGIVLLGIIICIGVFGNIHVLVIFFRKFKVSTYRLFVIWLALQDTVNCGFSAPLIIFYVLHPVTYPYEGLCKFTRFILYFSAISSTSTMVVIAIDRYRKILRPYNTQISTVQAKIMCGFSALVAILLSWPAPLLYGLSQVPTGIPGLHGFRCFTEDGFKETQYMAVLHIVHGCYFITVTLSLLTVYSFISKQILNSKKFRQSTSSASSKSLNESSVRCIGKNVKMTLTLITITVAYILCALPHHALALLYFFSHNLDCTMTLFGSQLYYTFIWSYFVNSAINPCIYALRDEKFREEIKNMYGNLFSGKGG